MDRLVAAAASGCSFVVVVPVLQIAVREFAAAAVAAPRSESYCFAVEDL